MKSKAIVLGFVMLLLAGILSGCVEKERIVDMYQDSIGDGTLNIPDDVCGIHINITYIGSVCWDYNLSSFLIDVAPLVIDGKDLLDPDGDRWVRD